MIDWERLTSLRDDIGPEDFAEVLNLFLAEMAEKLSQLDRAPARSTSDDFHFLRGSAANLGFTGMVAACEAAEANCRDGTVPDLGAVSRAFCEAVAAARPHVPELPAA